MEMTKMIPSELTNDMLKDWVYFCAKVGPEIGVADAVAEMMAKELLELREKTRWIPVAEKLPREEELVVFINSKDYIYLGIYANGEWCDDKGERNGVTHWMPLPELPNE